MSTILSSYNLANGDTTSSVFTYSGSSRNLDIEITPTGLTGYSSYCFVETSADNVNWIKTPQSDLSIKESDAVIYHITQSEGAYVRVKLFRMDSHSGTVTITASEQSGGGTGDLLSTNNLSDVANAETSNHNLGNSHTTYVPTFTPLAGALSTCTCLGDSFVIQIDTDSISFTMQLAITMDALETAAAFDFDLPTGLLPYANFAATSDLTPIISLPNSGSWADLLTQNVVIGANAGAKTGNIGVVSPAASVVKLPIFIRYHR